jgi:hypothetical protein
MTEILALQELETDGMPAEFNGCEGCTSSSSSTIACW